MWEIGVKFVGKKRTGRELHKAKLHDNKISVGR